MSYQISALYDFQAGTSAELSFFEGDVLNVTSDDNPDWYEAEFNGFSGMVPKNYFEVMGDDQMEIADEGVEVYERGRYNSMHMAKPVIKPSVLIVTAIYPYEARNEEELTIEEGETLQIVDDTDPDWYVAKPIARLGQTGLVPKTYCEVVDTGGKGNDGKKKDKDVKKEQERLQKEKKKEEDKAKQQQKDEERLRKAEEDKVKAEEMRLRKEEERKRKEEENQVKAEENRQRKEEERKRKEEDQRRKDEEDKIKAEELRLRKEEERKRKEEEQRRKLEEERMAKEQFRGQMTAMTGPRLIACRVPYFEKQGSKHFFVVEVQTDQGTYSLMKSYQDFYNFHLDLMDCYPVEAGQGGANRILPYLPGQKLFVNDAVTKMRRQDLDEYVCELVRLPQRITQSRICEEFFKGGEVRLERPVSQFMGSAPAPPSRPPPSSSGGGASAPPPPSSRPPAPSSRPPAPSTRPPTGTSGGAPPPQPPRPSSGPGSAAAGTGAGRPPPPSSGPPRSQPARQTSPTGPAQVSGPLPTMPLMAASAPAPAPAATSAPAPANNMFRPRPPTTAPPSKQQSAIELRSTPAAPADSFRKSSLPTSSMDPGNTRPAAGSAARSNLRPVEEASSNVSSGNSNAFRPSSADTVKIKVAAQDNIVAFMVSPNVSLSEVKSKAFRKLDIRVGTLSYKDEDGDSVTVGNDDDLRVAIELTGPKLRLFVA